MAISVTVRTLSGKVELELEDNATTEDVKRAANCISGTILRSGGVAVEGEQPVESGQEFVAAPPSAKHGG